MSQGWAFFQTDDVWNLFMGFGVEKAPGHLPSWVVFWNCCITEPILAIFNFFGLYLLTFSGYLIPILQFFFPHGALALCIITLRHLYLKVLMINLCQLSIGDLASDGFLFSLNFPETAFETPLEAPGLHKEVDEGGNFWLSEGDVYVLGGVHSVERACPWVLLADGNAHGAEGTLTPGRLLLCLLD